MKRLLLALFCCCSLTLPIFGESSHEWDIFREKVVKMIPSIPGWCPHEKALRMMNLIYETKPSVCVEVGIFGGSSYFPTLCALQFNKKGVGYAIDPWENLTCMEGQTGLHLEWWKKVNLRSIYSGFIDLIHNYKLDARSAVLRMTSKDALKFFSNNSIDILHIDGNHAEDSAYFDAMHWLSKVKVGGYIWFDDTDWDSTQKAVQYLLQYCEMDTASHLRDPYILLKKIKDDSEQLSLVDNHEME